MPLPGLVASPAGSVSATSAQVELRGDAVALKLSLRQTGKAAALVIRGPRFSWSGDADPYPDRQFPELRAEIDGVNLALQDDFAVFYGERTITADIRQAGLDPFVIATSPPFVDRAGGAGLAAFERLAGLHAVEQSDDHFMARWTAQRLFRFKLGNEGQPTISLFYSARPGFALLSWDNLSRFVPLKAFCVTLPELRERFAGGRQTSPNVIARNYVLAVGIGGKASREVRARVADPNAVFCGVDGKPVWGGADEAPAFLGDGGVVRVLRLDPPG